MEAKDKTAEELLRKRISIQMALEGRNPLTDVQWDSPRHQQLVCVVIDAMEEYSTAQNASLKEENTKLREQLSVHDKCDEIDWNWNKRTIALKEENERLKAALDEILYPVKYMQIRAKEAGAELNGVMAVTLAESTSYLRDIARAALSPI
jgi:hypothetical protein